MVKQVKVDPSQGKWEQKIQEVKQKTKSNYEFWNAAVNFNHRMTQNLLKVK